MSALLASKKIIWMIGLLSGILGVIGRFALIQILSEYNYTFLLIGLGWVRHPPESKADHPDVAFL